jgi:ferredoxin
MKELQDLARKLLSEGTVKVVIGYEEGPRGARAAFITDPEQAEKLIFDNRCVQNLAAYLNPRRKQIAVLGKPAVVVKGCDARSVAGLLRENQITRDSVVIIAMQCSGVCEPKLYDHYIKSAHPTVPPVNPKRAEQLAALAKMSAAERWDFWSKELSRCIRCHACREACPMCFCVQCTADKGTPLWIDSSSTPRANRAWQTMRVLHQAGRCVDCLECERACPEHIPLGLLTRYVADSVERRFDYKAGDDPSVVAPMSVYRPDDDEEFIR